MVVCGGGAILVLGLIVAFIAVYSHNKTQLQKRVDDITQDVRGAIALSQKQCSNDQWNAAAGTARDALSRLQVSGVSQHLKPLADRLAQCEQDAKNAEVLHARRVSEGWIVFEGKFMSPDEKGRILNRRYREAEQRAAAEQQKRQERLAAAKAEEERLAAAEKRRAAEEARVRHGPYKAAAQPLTDNLLKVISATETGITLNKYSEMLQELQFTYNKFLLACDDRDKEFHSFQHLSSAVEFFRFAQGCWQRKTDESLKDHYQSADEEEKRLQEAWKKGQRQYVEAMKDLANDN